MTNEIERIETETGTLKSAARALDGMGIDHEPLGHQDSVSEYKALGINYDGNWVGMEDVPIGGQLNVLEDHFYDVKVVADDKGSLPTRRATYEQLNSQAAELDSDYQVMPEEGVLINSSMPTEAKVASAEETDWRVDRAVANYEKGL